MIYFLVLIFFFLYSFVLFIIDNIYLLCLFFLFNLIISLFVRISFKKHFKVLVTNLTFILFIILCNFLFSSIEESLKVGIRLFLAIDYTYIMGNYFNPSRIRMAFRYLFSPLKLLKVDIAALTLILSISLAFIPILMDEAKMIKISLKSKGFDFNFKNVITKPHIYLITFLNGLFDRVDEIERSLQLKGY